MNRVLVTGCSRGLGFLLQESLVNSGCFVIPHFRNTSQAIDTSSKFVSGDICNTNTLDSMISVAKENNINVLVNNAAIHYRKSILDHTDDEIEDLINVNIVSQIKLLKRFYSFFLESKNGLIININSVAGIQPAPNETVYSATKHAMKGFSQSLQVESIGKNVRIIDIFPGAMKTDMTLTRENYETLIDPSEVANRINKIICDKSMTSLETEVVIRKFNRG